MQACRLSMQHIIVHAHDGDDVCSIVRILKVHARIYIYIYDLHEKGVYINNIEQKNY